jgi:hypothetical protein
MAPNREKQLLVTGLLAYATYITYICPCRKLLSCHLPHYFGSVGIATAIVLAENSDSF